VSLGGVACEYRVRSGTSLHAAVLLLPLILLLKMGTKYRNLIIGHLAVPEVYRALSG
jgi:hypothetical protein